MKLLDNISRSERATAWLFILIWCQPVIVNYAFTFMNRFLGLSYEVSHGIIIPALYIILTLMSLQNISSKLRTGDWAFYFIFLAVYFLSFVLHPENEEYLSTLVTTLPFSVLPMYLLGVAMDFSSIKKILYYGSVANIILQFVFFRFLSVSLMEGFHDQDHYMNLAYTTMPSAIYVLWCTFKSPKVYNIIYSILGIFLILSFGTRGPFLALLFFVGAYIILYRMNDMSLTRKLAVCAICAALYFISMNYLSSVFDYLGRTGGSTRIIGWILGTDTGAIESSESRLDIIDLAWSELKKSNYLGLGFAGDRTFMGGFYVHNIIIEFLLSYGLFIGALLMAALFIRLIKGEMRTLNSENGVFMLLLISIGLLPLMVSGSYVTEPWFYFMLGYSTQCIRNNSCVTLIF